jgi:Sulfatase
LVIRPIRARWASFGGSELAVMITVKFSSAAIRILYGWLALAAINQPFVALQGGLHTLANRLALHIFDLGQFLALGLFSAALLWLRDRFPLGKFSGYRRSFEIVLGFASASALAALVLPLDFSGFASRMEERGSHIPWGLIVPVGVGMAMTLVAHLVRRFSAGSMRWLLLTTGGMIAIANNIWLRGDYFGIHLFVAITDALILGGGVTSFVPINLSPGTRRLHLAVPVGLALCALPAIGILPGNAVRLAFYRIPGSVLAPFQTRLLSRPTIDTNHVTPFARGPWFAPRASAPGVASSRPSLVPTNPIVLLITIDAFRADLLGSDKHAAVLPALSRLRDESVFFEQNRSVSPSTFASLFSMMTGKYYSATYWSKKTPAAETTPHLDPTPRLAQLLNTNDPSLYSAHVMAVRGLAADKGTGVGFTEEIQPDKDYEKAEKIVDTILDVVTRHVNEKVLVYTHLIDPHLPYTQKPGDASSFVGYLREVADVDRSLQRLRDALEKLGVWQRCVLMVTGDHGEEFAEHGGRGHAVTMYDELLRVPLMVRVPGVEPQRIAVQTSTMDVGPTLLDLLGFETPGHWMGQSLVPFLRGESPSLERPIAGDASRRMQMIVFPNGIKVIEDLHRRTLEIYNLRADPGETDNLLEVMGPAGDEYVNGLRLFFKVNAYTRDGYVPPIRRF